MRKGMDGLLGEVRARWSDDPFAGHLFIFPSRDASRVKILWWSDGGLCLFAKRLEKGHRRVVALTRGRERACGLAKAGRPQRPHARGQHDQPRQRGDGLCADAVEKGAKRHGRGPWVRVAEDTRGGVGWQREGLGRREAVTNRVAESRVARL